MATDAVSRVLLFQRARADTANPSVLSPALLPALNTIGYRLWRKGQTTFAILPKNCPLDAIPRPPKCTR